ncbi:MAG: Lrp/AsnC family transcriptional regulator [Candidatus Schekmanbacteria bacterium]|nr:MAG: Lrp/AsnC family transcriptional regulator [Candidatus Schekmanbacteria bacterium]
MKIDEINISIIKHLRDGRKSFKEIAESLDISENTVRARVGKLIEEGVLDIAGLVNPDAIPNHKIAIIGVKLSNVTMVKNIEKFSKLKGVVSVSIVTGRYDLMMIVMLKDGFELLDFYQEEMSKMKNIQSVETFIAYKSYNLKVPYLL